MLWLADSIRLGPISVNVRCRVNASQPISHTLFGPLNPGVLTYDLLPGRGPSFTDTLDHENGDGDGPPKP